MKMQAFTLVAAAALGTAMAGCETVPAFTPAQKSATAPATTAGAQSAVQPVADSAQKPAASTLSDPFHFSTVGAPTHPRTRTAGFASGRPGFETDAPSTATMQPEALARSVFADARGPGGNLSQITFALEGADFDPDVSRDGKRIVFASTQHRAMSDIYIKDVGSRVVTQLTNEPAHDVMPKISPDGQRIAFASNRSGSWDIYVMPITGGRAIQITSGTSDDLHPSWSPDGAQLVFCRLGEVSGQWELWTTEVANNGVARFIGNGLFPQWSPVAGTGANGADKIVFQRSRERGDRSFSIWTLDVKDGQAFNATEIASSPTGACINPAWSPDGHWIAYATVPNPRQWGASGRPPAADLFLVDLGGSNRVSLTSGVGINLMPSWAGNNRLFFVSNRAGVDNVWAMDTTEVMRLARSNASGTSGFAGPSSNDTFTGDQTPSVVSVPFSGDDGSQ